MKLIERKRTTKVALECLEILVNSFDGKLPEDVNSVISKDFYARVNVNNGLYTNDFNYKAWDNVTGFWRIKKGVLGLISEDINSDYNRNKEDLEITSFDQINFKDCLENLELVISLHNTKCEEKDEQILEFINFCSEYLKREK